MKFIINGRSQMRKIILLLDTKGPLAPTNHENVALFYERGRQKSQKKPTLLNL